MVQGAGVLRDLGPFCCYHHLRTGGSRSLRHFALSTGPTPMAVLASDRMALSASRGPFHRGFIAGLYGESGSGVRIILVFPWAVSKDAGP
jgi:hypothetical protein